MTNSLKLFITGFAFLGIAGSVDLAVAQGRGGDRGGYDRGGYDRGGRGGYDRGYDRQVNRPPPPRQPLDFSYGRPDRRVYNERPDQWRPSRPSFFGR